MTDHRSYGTGAHSADELAQLVSTCLDTVFTKRESDYRGVYYIAKDPDRRIEIQPNAVPGECGVEEFYAPEHPSVEVLVLTSTSTDDPALRQRLISLEGLTDLGSP